MWQPLEPVWLRLVVPECRIATRWREESLDSPVRRSLQRLAVALDSESALPQPKAVELLVAQVSGAMKLELGPQCWPRLAVAELLRLV